MTRIILATLLLSFFGFSSVFANTFEGGIPYPVPFTYNNVTYDKYIVFHRDNLDICSNTHAAYFVSSEMTAAGWPNNTNYFSLVRGYYYGAPAINLNAPDTHMVFFDAFLDGTVCRWKTQPEYDTTVSQGAPNLAGAGTPDTALGEYNFDLYTKNYIWGSLPYTWPYPYESWGTWEDGALYLESSVPPQHQLNITRSPELGGGVSDYPAGENILCGIDGYTRCQASYPLNTQVTLDAYPNEGYAFSHWEINGLAMADVDGSIPVTMDETKNVVAVFYLKADDFVFPVLAQGVTDPLLNNTLNPDGNGWHGSDVGELALYEGHLGQDYSVDSGSSVGKPVHAVSNGTIVEIMNDPAHAYGWRCDDGDHGWGPVVVIRHENRDGFNTNGSIITGSCDTEINPTVIYSLYGHLSKASIQNLQIGQAVRKGDPLGELGTPGTDWSATINMPAHLHFELKDEMGFLEGSWYVTHPGECPQETSQNCNAKGIGRGYSHSYGFAPHRYSPDEFIFNN